MFQVQIHTVVKYLTEIKEMCGEFQINFANIGDCISLDRFPPFVSFKCLLHPKLLYYPTFKVNNTISISPLEKLLLVTDMRTLPM